MDPALTAAVASGYLRILPQRRAWIAERIADHLGSDPDDHVADAERYWLQRVESRWGQARGISFTGWRPSVELKGADRLYDAVAAGNGVVLWRMSGHSAIPLNRALADAGWPPVHLSRPNHLLLTRPSPLWQAVWPRVAPLVRRGEERDIRRRVELSQHGAAGATRQIMNALRGGEVVTIVGDLSTGTKTRSVLVNRWQLEFANGGARLAARTGAVLLPISVRRVAAMRYVVEIGRALPSPATGTIDASIDAFAARLADWIRDDPSQWPKWRATIS